MKKYILGDCPRTTLNFYTNAKSFGAGAKFDIPDLREKIKAFRKEGGKIIVTGVSYTRCSIAADNVSLGKIEHILNDYIDTPIGDVENIEII